MAFLVYSRLDQKRCRPNTIKPRLPLEVLRYYEPQALASNVGSVITAGAVATASASSSDSDDDVSFSLGHMDVSTTIIVFTARTPGR